MSNKISVIERNGTITKYTLTKEQSKKIAELIPTRLPKTYKIKPLKDKSLRRNQCKNLAYLSLLNANITTLPIDLDQIIRTNQFITLGYYKDENAINLFNLPTDNKDGFCIKYKNNYIICYNDQINKLRQRWTIAHEIGHIILKHQLFTVKNFEREAHDFAQNLLCPLVAFDLCKINIAKAAMQLFNISEQAAQIALKDYLDVLSLDRLYKNPLEIAFAERLQTFAKEYTTTHEEITCLDEKPSLTLPEQWLNKAMKNKLTDTEVFNLSYQTLNMDKRAESQPQTISVYEAYDIFRKTYAERQKEQGEKPQGEYNINAYAYASTMLDYYFQQHPYLKDLPREAIEQIFKKSQELKQELFKE